MKIETAILLFGFFGVASGARGWGYGDSTNEAYGPKDWYKVNAVCGSDAQSPINLGRCSYKSPKVLPPLEFDFDSGEEDFDDDDDAIEGKLVNNGHAPVMNIDKTKGTYTVSGGPLKNTFKLQQFHFHFGCNNRVGSEHTEWNQAYPGELHLVFYNTKYGTFSAAADKPDGLAVVGVFLKHSIWENRGLKALEPKLKSIMKEDSSVQVQDFQVMDLVPELRKKHVKYYTYKGSLTTPPCYESVRWIVLKRKIRVNNRQLTSFRALEATHGYHHGRMCNNYRPVQPLNRREVECPW